MKNLIKALMCVLSMASGAVFAVVGLEAEIPRVIARKSGSRAIAYKTDGVTLASHAEPGAILDLPGDKENLDEQLKRVQVAREELQTQLGQVADASRRATSLAKTANVHLLHLQKGINAAKDKYARLVRNLMRRSSQHDQIGKQQAEMLSTVGQTADSVEEYTRMKLQSLNKDLRKLEKTEDEVAQELNLINANIQPLSESTPSAN
jgi:chromosome segregation ATPase